MAIASVLQDSFKEQLLGGYHSFNASGDTPAGSVFKIALYTSSADLTTTTTVYVTSGEVASGGGYTTAGEALTNTGVAKTTVTSYTDFSDVSWTDASFTANAALIYNTTTGTGSSTTDAVAAIAFGGDKTATSGTFTIQFPAAAASTAILRIA